MNPTAFFDFCWFTISVLIKCQFSSESQMVTHWISSVNSFEWNSDSAQSIFIYYFFKVYLYKEYQFALEDKIK